jgi:hypothetical protein
VLAPYDSRLPAAGSIGSLIRANLLIGLILESHVRILSSEWTKWCNRPRTDRGVARSRKAASGQDESRREGATAGRHDGPPVVLG